MSPTPAALHQARPALQLRLARPLPGSQHLRGKRQTSSSPAAIMEKKAGASKVRAGTHGITPPLHSPLLTSTPMPRYPCLVHHPTFSFHTSPLPPQLVPGPTAPAAPLAAADAAV